MNKPRFEPHSMNDLSDHAKEILNAIPGSGLKGDGFPRGVLGQLLHSPELLDYFLAWWVACKSGFALSNREQELVILRMACLYDCNYVWQHHVRVGKEYGINEIELDAIQQRKYQCFIAREKCFLELTDELITTKTLRAILSTDPITPRELIDLIALISQYTLFCLTNNALQVPLEHELI